MLNTISIKKYLLYWIMVQGGHLNVFEWDQYIAADITQNSSGTVQLIIDKTTGEISQPDASVDLVVALYSLEHVNDFGGAFEEISRVIKPGGELLCLVPFINREHEVPYDYLRFTSFFWKQARILEYFNVVNIDKIGNSWVTILALWYERFTSEDERLHNSFFSRGIRKVYVNTLLPLFNLTLFRKSPTDDDVVYYQLLVHLIRH